MLWIFPALLPRIPASFDKQPFQGTVGFNTILPPHGTRYETSSHAPKTPSSLLSQFPILVLFLVTYFQVTNSVSLRNFIQL